MHIKNKSLLFVELKKGWCEGIVNTKEKHLVIDVVVVSLQTLNLPLASASAMLN